MDPPLPRERAVPARGPRLRRLQTGRGRLLSSQTDVRRDHDNLISNINWAKRIFSFSTPLNILSFAGGTLFLWRPCGRHPDRRKAAFPGNDAARHHDVLLTVLFFGALNLLALAILGSISRISEGSASPLFHPPLASSVRRVRMAAGATKPRLFARARSQHDRVSNGTYTNVALLMMLSQRCKGLVSRADKAAHAHPVPCRD